ncbi:MAG TPA: glycosyltransferase [Actinocrinis sp.]|uniref:glycosyltransferase n=1 Tax=Actinocrinis sp. TaxID=1920516 RepID=UPI002DDD674D|nr:glycosyltransferase [Actinocrinis sp.]HEV2344991.1 glycosyltransferase [Actinocrinis sp.]
MNVLMLVMSDVAHDSRVMREAIALADHGHAIHIVGKDVPQGWNPPHGGITVESVSGGSGFNRPGGGASGGGSPSSGVPSAAPSGGALSSVKRVARWVLLPQHRQKVWRTWCSRAETAVAGREFDVVHAHDFNVLRLAARIADREGARLVYDSHELWSGRERHGRPTPLERARERRAEQRIVRRADAVLTVSDGIAERLGGWRGGEVKVVRNTFPGQRNASGMADSEITHIAVRQRPAGVVYAGRIGPARDLETLLPAAAAAGLDAVLMGPVDHEYLPRIQAAAGTVRIEPARPVDEVDDVLRGAGISVVTLTDSCENHRLALPNKLFHAVRAGVPVVAADLPELRRIVTQYGLGALYRPGDVASLRAAFKQVAADYPRLCEQVARAKADLSWERDAAVLVGVYESLAGRGAVSVGSR